MDREDDGSGVPLFRREFLDVGAGVGAATVGGSRMARVARAVAGDLRWKFETGGSVGTPTIVDGTVYAGSFDDHVYAVDATTGTEKWRFRVGGWPYWAPNVVEETVYVGSSPGNVYALDAETGSKRWQFPTGDAVRSSPTARSGTVYVGSLDGNVYAIDAASGDERWRFETGNWVESSPAVVDGTVYVGSEDDNLYALDAETGGRQWRFETDGEVATAPTVVDGTVYASSYDGTLYAVDAADGSERWRLETPSRFQSSPTVADGTVYVGNRYDHLYAADADTGAKQWTAALPTRSSPTVADGTVFIGSGYELLALDAETGAKRWRFETGGNADAAPTVVDGTVYVGSTDNNLYALDAGVEGSSVGSRVRQGTLGHHHVWARQISSPPTLNSEVTVTAQGDSTRPGERATLGLAVTNDGSAAAQNVAIWFQADGGEPGNADYYGTEFEVVEHENDGGDWAVEGWSWAQIPAGESRTPSVTVRAAEDLDPGEYVFTVELYVGGSAAGRDTATVTVGGKDDEQRVDLQFLPETTRPVQTVEFTSVPSQQVDRSVDFVDMVAGKPTSVLFGLDAGDLSELSDEWRAQVTLRRVRNGDERVHEFALSREAVDRLDFRDDYTGNFPALTFDRAPTDQTPPVFDLSASLDRLELEIDDGAGESPNDRLVLDRGEAFEVAETGEFRIGFIEVQAPQSARNTVGDADGRILTRLRDPDSGDVWTLANHQDTMDIIADEVETYLERTFPVASVSTAVHPNRIVGTAQQGAYQQDLEAAHARLSERFGEFDATVAIVPTGYFVYHRDGPAGGVEVFNGDVALTPTGTDVDNLTHPHTATAVRDQFAADGTIDPRDVAAVAAQEIGHHLQGWLAYPDAFSMRHADNDDGTVLDNSHARTEDRVDTDRQGRGSTQISDTWALRSRAYDFADGTYRLLREGGADGYWGRSRDTPDFGQERAFRLESFMSYGSDDRWIDGHVYQAMIDDGLSPTPPVTVEGGNEADAEATFVGVGRRTADGIEILHASRRARSPPPAAAEGATIRTRTDQGDVLTTSTVVPQTVLTHHGGAPSTDETFLFEVAYPASTATVEIEYQQQTRTVNPAVRTLEGLIRAVPERGFSGTPQRAREALLSTTEQFRNHMNAGDYDDARESLAALEAAVRDRVRQEYDAAANEPTRADLLEEIEDVRGRIQSVESDGSGETGSGLPDWLPLAGGGAALGIGLYRYLSSSGDETEQPDE